MCIIGGESEYGCVGSHNLVNFPQSVLPCMLAGEIGIFCKNSSVTGKMVGCCVLFGKNQTVWKSQLAESS
jgi:hypothetical protein